MTSNLEKKNISLRTKTKHEIIRSIMFNFEETKPAGIFKFIGIGQQVSWKRSDGIHRFAAMRFGLSRRGIARTVQSDQTGEVAESFFDGIRVALQETIAMEPLSIEPSTLVQFRFRSPDGRWVSTKLTPLGDGDIHSLVSGVLQNTLGSSPNFVVDKLEIFYTRPAQGSPEQVGGLQILVSKGNYIHFIFDTFLNL